MLIIYNMLLLRYIPLYLLNFDTSYVALNYVLITFFNVKLEFVLFSTFRFIRSFKVYLLITMFLVNLN